MTAIRWASTSIPTAALSCVLECEHKRYLNRPITTSVKHLWNDELFALYTNSLALPIFCLSDERLVPFSLPVTHPVLGQHDGQVEAHQVQHGVRRLFHTSLRQRGAGCSIIPWPPFPMFPMFPMFPKSTAQHGIELSQGSTMWDVMGPDRTRQRETLACTRRSTFHCTFSICSA